MAKKNLSIVDNNIIISMATLLLIMAIVLVGVSRSKQQTRTVTKAAPQPDLLSESSEIEDLQNDLKFLESDPIIEEMKVFETLQ